MTTYRVRWFDAAAGKTRVTPVAFDKPAAEARADAARKAGHECVDVFEVHPLTGEPLNPGA